MVENVPATARTSSPARRAFEAFGALLDGPLTGLAPWIVLGVFEGPGRLVVAAGVALALSVVFVVVDLARGRSLKILGVVDVAFFAGLLMLHFSIDEAGQEWMEVWVGEIANVTLVLIAVGSMLARVPFTIQYAREEVEEQYWRTPTFLRVNYVITGAWALAFLIAAVAGFYGDAILDDPDNLWTGWVIQTAALLCALQFTNWYPDVARARAAVAEGRPAEPVPPLRELFAPLAVWLVPIGIITLAMDGGPTWLGIAFIVVGVGTNALLRRNSTEVAR
ncbi:hypothetical protein FK531_05880 [Rhodococcus spelaei]|uniref:Uncharacterized protein n=1 Tax=Rhodococcus spelaei TaxID=2546320 RepID=A0A541BPC1_9NOCA|nr:hypothetical protein [Rhodococcus spelaei]TQF74173.1 hypothetical protein FK531_05880 [Rhodococcus spelaei]